MIDTRFQDSRAVGAINSPYRSEVMSGLYKARVTGEQLETDNQYLQIIFNGQEMYARPCYGFGSRISVPSKAWLQKFKNEIFIWIVFEESEFRSPVWLGWCFNEGKQTSLYNFPDSDVYRTEKFEEVFDDKTNEYFIKQTDNKKQSVYIKDTSIEVSAAKMVTIVGGNNDVTTQNSLTLKQDSVTIETTNDATLKQSKLVAEAKSIFIGSGNSSEAMVLGNVLNTNITSLIDALDAFATLMDTYTQTQTTAASASTPLNPLVGGLSALKAGVGTFKANLQTVKTSLSKHLSSKTKVE